MPERYRVTPRTPGPIAHHAYGYRWPDEGREVSAETIGADTLLRLDADPAYTVERIPESEPESGDEPSKPEGGDEPPKREGGDEPPKPPPRRRKS